MPSPTLRILLVEDDDALAEVYQRILSRTGAYDVRRSGSMGGALDRIREGTPDVVVLDLGLPDSQGLGGLALILGLAPGAAVIITTGVSDENLAIEALRNGAQDYLLKGKLDASTLTRSVRYALERKQAENKLRHSEELFSVITNNMVDLLAIVDANGQRLYTSPSYLRVLGYTQEEMAGKLISDLLFPDDVSGVKDALTRLFAEGSSRGLEYRLRHKDGTYRFFESNAALIPDPQNKIAQAILVARDITERKAAERERERMEVQLRHSQKLESIGQLAAGIAHEINTPTQYIGDNAIFLRDAFQDLARVVESQERLLEELTAGGGVPETVADARRIFQEADPAFLLEEIPKAIEQSLEGVRRVTKIVGAMKEFSHPGSDSKTRTDLNRAIESTVTVCRNEWKYVADLELDLSPELPLVPCLPGEFNQALLNLVINAAHAIEAKGTKDPGKERIRIRTRPGVEDVEIRIEDTGVGIPEAILSRIFDPFFTTKPVGKGSGQGLAIVHSSIVDKHGGSISVESRLGEGTTFTLRLPLKEA